MRIDSKLIPPNIARLMSNKDKPKSYKSPEQISARSDEKLEKVLQEQIASLLRQRGIPFHRNRMDKKTTGTVGWPDFCFPYNGRFYGVECKIGSNRPSPSQELCLDAITKCGGQADVVYSLEQFKSLLD